MAPWAADCAERVLPYFEEESPEDDRPRRPIQAARAWASGELRMGECRAAGHAAATAHMATRAPHAAGYAARAVAHASTSTDPATAAEERDRQHRRLPEHLRSVVLPARGDD